MLACLLFRNPLLAGVLIPGLDALLILGEFASRMWLKVLSWLVAGGIIGLNAWLLVRTVAQWGGLASAPVGVSLLLFAIT